MIQDDYAPTRCYSSSAFDYFDYFVILGVLLLLFVVCTAVLLMIAVLFKNLLNLNTGC
jgi:hypothetical protein